MKTLTHPIGIREYNFDGLVGPSHNYAGLSQGNLASAANKNRVSNPKLAALQGLDKMAYLISRGLGQAIIPPLFRPDIDWLRRLGFTGKDAQVLEKVGKQNPVLLATAWSASSMWTANAATLSPSLDSIDGHVHITPANLTSQLHRSLETPYTAELLRKIFIGPSFFHHSPLPSNSYFGDEGAANHIRLSPGPESKGLQIFVYGYASNRKISVGAEQSRYLSRQSLDASQAIARLHALRPEATVFARQKSKAIDAGVFHNDVIAVGRGSVLFCHSEAFENQAQVLREIKRKYAALTEGKDESPKKLRIIEVKSAEVPLAVAVSTYLFNSQLLFLPEGGLLLLAAKECHRHPQTRKFLEKLPGLGLGITEVAFVDLRQSMRNGGGPACLRLRADLSTREWANIAEGIKVNGALLTRLRDWVERFYRDRLHPHDLKDPELLREMRAAHGDLFKILQV